MVLVFSQRMRPSSKMIVTPSLHAINEMMRSHKGVECHRVHSEPFSYNGFHELIDGVVITQLIAAPVWDPV